MNIKDIRINAWMVVFSIVLLMGMILAFAPDLVTVPVVMAVLVGFVAITKDLVSDPSPVVPAFIVTHMLEQQERMRICETEMEPFELHFHDNGNGSDHSADSATGYFAEGYDEGFNHGHDAGVEEVYSGKVKAANPAPDHPPKSPG